MGSRSTTTGAGTGASHHIAYCYDRAGRYTHWETAEESPEEKGVILWPANSTPVRPSRLPAIWDGVAWGWDGTGTAIALRKVRDYILGQTDYCALPDMPMCAATRAEVIRYRQRLRDLPQQPGFPARCVWPEPPVHQYFTHIKTKIMTKFVSSTANQPLDELVDVIAFLFTTVDTYKRAKGDGGGLNLLDIPKVFDLVRPGTQAYEGIELIPGAWANASTEEKYEVYAYFVDRFDLANDVAEQVVEKGVGAAALILDIVILLRHKEAA